MNQPKPSEGDIVHYVLKDGPRDGEVRAAIICRVWTDTMVNLQVVADGQNDLSYCNENLYWSGSKYYDADGTPGTWHYRE